MHTYHKIFKANPSFYLSNPEPVLSCNEDFLNRLTGATNTEELHNAKVSILRDFRTIYVFDAIDAEFPEPIGYFADNREKCEFVKKKILLHDVVLYLGSVLKKYYGIIYQTYGRLPEIECEKLAIDYNEIYCKTMDDYVETIRNGSKHAIAASFILPTLIEQSIGMALQNRMLRKYMAEAKGLAVEEKELLAPFYGDSHIFYGREAYIMGKVYKLFVRKDVLKNSPDNEIMLTGSSRKREGHWAD